MRGIKYIIGFTALVLFFLLIDSSGIGFKKHIATIKEWALGKKSKLYFTVYGNNGKEK